MFCGGFQTRLSAQEGGPVAFENAVVGNVKQKKQARPGWKLAGGLRIKE